MLDTVLLKVRSLQMPVITDPMPQRGMCICYKQILLHSNTLHHMTTTTFEQVLQHKGSFGHKAVVQKYMINKITMLSYKISKQKNNVKTCKQKETVKTHSLQSERLDAC